MSSMVDKLFYEKELNNNVTWYVDDDNIYKALTPKSLKQILRDYVKLMDKYSTLQSGIISDFLYDITVAINTAKLSKHQRVRLDMWLKGLTEREIASFCGVTRQVVNKSMTIVCERILDELRGEMT